MTPPRDKGPVPAIELALIDSSLNHLRDQTDRDRRAMAERLIDLRDWREKTDGQLATMSGQLMRIDDRAARLEKDGALQTKVLTELTDSFIEARGSLRAFRWVGGALMALLSAIEIVAHLAVHR